MSKQGPIVETVDDDAELYGKLSQPHPPNVGDELLARFIQGVEDLREACGIPDVVVACGVVVQRDETAVRKMQLASFGDQNVVIELGARVFKHFTLPVIDQGDRLRDIARGTSPVKR